MGRFPQGADSMHELSAGERSRTPLTGSLCSSERNLVIQIAALAAACHRGLARCGPRGAEVAGIVIAELAAAAPAAGAVEHGQRRVEALQHDFGGIFLNALLVGPFARLQLPFEVNLRALLQILLGDLGETLVEDYDAVPLGLFLALAGRLVAPAFRRRDAHVHDRAAVLHAPDLRVLAQI